MSTIKITDEMEQAYISKAYAEHEQATAAVVSGLEAVVAIIERDYTVAGGPIPDGVNEIKDEDGDVWHRLADGRWILKRTGLIKPLGDVRSTYGPVTW